MLSSIFSYVFFLHPTSDAKDKRLFDREAKGADMQTKGVKNGMVYSWVILRGASGDIVPSTCPPLLDLSAAANNSFSVLPAYFLRNRAFPYPYLTGGAVVKAPLTYW
jgi:hypothetical protein